MKKILFFLSFFLYIFSIFSNEPDRINFHKDYSFLYSLYHPCEEGSDNEKKLINYIETVCVDNNLSYQIKDISFENEYVSYSKNIEIEINNNSDKEYVVFICPLNSIAINQKVIDNSLSIQVTLELILKINEMKNNLNKNYLFLFSGAIGYDDAYLGFNKFLESSERYKNSVVNIIDVLSINNVIKFKGSMNNRKIPENLLESFLKVFPDSKSIFLDVEEIDRSGFNLISYDNYATFFLKNDITTVIFSNRENIILDQFYFNIDLQKELINYLYLWSISLDKLNFPVEKSYNYQIFRFFGKYFILKETYQILIFVALIFIIILVRTFIPFFQRVRIIFILKILPNFLFLFILFYILSLIPFILTYPIGLIVKSRQIYMNMPLLYLCSIFFIPFMLILILKDSKLSFFFPKHNYLYIIASLIFLTINIFLIALIDFSMIYIFLWSIIMITLSNFTGRNFILKLLFYLLSPLPMILLIIKLFYFSDVQLIKNILENIFLQNLFFCIIFYPFMLLAVRTIIILKSVFKIFANKTRYAVILFVFLTAMLTFFILISSNLSFEDHEIKITKTSNFIKNSNSIDINSNLNIGELSIDNSPDILRMNIKDKEFHYEIISYDKPYEVSFKTRNVGLNKNITVKFNSISKIKYLDVYVLLPKNGYPYESNFNVKKVENFFLSYDKDLSDVYKFMIPRNPRPNTKISFNIMKNKNFELYLKAESDDIKSPKISIHNDNHLLYQKSVYYDKIYQSLD